MAERREVRGVAAGAARGVERDAYGETGEDRPDDRLLDLDQLVPGWS